VSTPAGTSEAGARKPEDSHLSRIFEDDSWAWTRQRALRRRLVVGETGLLAALAVLTLWAASTDAGWTTAFTVAWCAAMVAFLPLHSLLNSGIRGVFDRSPRTLDEHQRRLRAQTYADVGWGNYALTFAAWTCGIAVVAVTGHTGLGLALAFVLWFSAGLLPYWRLAWTMPEEDGPDA
jgi:hypothetical protein